MSKCFRGAAQLTKFDSRNERALRRLGEWLICKIWYLISRTVFEDDAHRGSNDDRSVGAFAVKFCACRSWSILRVARMRISGTPQHRRLEGVARAGDLRTPCCSPTVQQRVLRTRWCIR